MQSTVMVHPQSLKCYKKCFLSTLLMIKIQLSPWRRILILKTLSWYDAYSKPVSKHL